MNNVKVGDYFNFSCWTDIYPGQVVEVKNAKTIIVEELEWKADDTAGDIGPGHQHWKIFHSETPSFKTFTLRKNGMWYEKGYAIGKGYRGRVSDEPYYYYDWCF